VNIWIAGVAPGPHSIKKEKHMERVVVYCDKCLTVMGEFDNSPSKLTLKTDRISDAAGSMEDVYVGYHLCENCKSLFINFILENTRFPGNLLKRFVEGK
jgi:hypothetical protein